MTAATQDDPSVFEEKISSSRGWIMATGIIMILAGTGAIVFPLISSFGVAICVAVLLVIAGIAQIIQAFSFHKWSRILLAVLVGLLWLAAGILLMLRPLEAIFVLTIFVAAAFLAEGVLKTIFAFKMRPATGWGWMLFNGIAAAAVGILLWWQLPFSALWTLGLLAGINIIISGWTLVMLASAIGKTTETPSTAKSAARSTKPDSPEANLKEI
ncbi:HdeD family acid-resistance protein [Sphingorhabdus sp. YGSMI21]|uniref:HdeD family acid-resistance protein n=1 Tax=Sphingorhabdus sp. YGSMI21 TaxID=2077182 RepID=UPI000C1F747B|nr:HdeD family acid-resistance protein [Sphingorhabdus sp. YGSMI21]ATW03077.1 hypothetical protein CHN51_05630 [Sphingorhabdus sp. YGSMI21]